MTLRAASRWRLLREAVPTLILAAGWVAFHWSWPGRGWKPAPILLGLPDTFWFPHRVASPGRMLPRTRLFFPYRNGRVLALAIARSNAALALSGPVGALVPARLR